MEHYKLDFKRLFLILITALLFTSCNKIINILNTFGIIPPQEQMLELQLERQAIEEPFTFADYCEEEYDSIFIVYSYFNTERDEFLNLKMSNILRRKCDNNTMFDSFSTLLFIKNGKVEAYSEIKCVDADFDSREVEKHYTFPIDQKFIMDKERIIHIYDE